VIGPQVAKQVVLLAKTELNIEGGKAKRKRKGVGPR